MGAQLSAERRFSAPQMWVTTVCLHSGLCSCGVHTPGAWVGRAFHPREGLM